SSRDRNRARRRRRRWSCSTSSRSWTRTRRRCTLRVRTRRGRAAPKHGRCASSIKYTSTVGGKTIAWMILSLACSGGLDPTEIRIEVDASTCDGLHSTALSFGVLGGDLESRPVGSRSDYCGGGSNHIGSFVVVPTDSSDVDVAFKVVTGVDVDPDACTAPKYEGCIVARRSISYLSHTPLTVDVTMSKLCKNQPCGPKQTCVDAQCFSAAVTDPAACEGDSGCSLQGGDASVVEDCGDMSGFPVGAVWPMAGACPKQTSQSRFPGPRAITACTNVLPNAVGFG